MTDPHPQRGATSLSHAAVQISEGRETSFVCSFSGFLKFRLDYFFFCLNCAYGSVVSLFTDRLWGVCVSRDGSHYTGYLSESKSSRGGDVFILFPSPWKSACGRGESSLGLRTSRHEAFSPVVASQEPRGRRHAERPDHGFLRVFFLPTPDCCIFILFPNQCSFGG